MSHPKTYTILCVDDEREVLDALVKDLQVFARGGFVVEPASSVAEARDVVRDLEPGTLALILCDHLMPGTLGVEFLVELASRKETARAKKVLVTGQAGLKDTVRAVNEAHLDHYIAKPWTGGDLTATVKKLLTDYIIEAEESPARFAGVLDFARIMGAIHDRDL